MTTLGNYIDALRAARADPPYGEIVDEAWDRAGDDLTFSDWLVGWTVAWSDLLVDGADRGAHGSG